ncbi:TrbC family F-type conjugative pilus assembly protein [Paraburkholderia sp. EG287A]|uniref:TrbC family F-type conjugative pilus assembly protein n=1 Tax=Paraburkholderia sp. EG287A TaxID=3237012 RepID=UPI0034D23E6D
MKKLTLSVAIAGMLATAAITAHADAGVDRMKSVMEAVTGGNLSTLAPADQQAAQTGVAGATRDADPNIYDKKTAEFAVEAQAKWNDLARQAYVSALPPADQAIGRSILLGDGTVPGSPGKLFFFVSRSMPLPLLRTYALEAFYLGGTLVVRGIRPGESVKEYVDEAVSDYNSAGNQVLSGIEINPNLFDMFNVTMVPSVVWTNRQGLDDIGAGCPNLPDNVQTPQVTVEGPDGSPITLDKPVCAPAPDSSFYKLTGALALPYVFDRFEQAGAPKAAIEEYRQELKEMAQNGVSADGVDGGHGLAGLKGDIKVEQLPKYVLRYWQQELATQKVQRAPYGPAFSEGGDDDPEYRQELEQKIQRGLGITQ